MELIDECFYVKETSRNIWISFVKEKPIITSLTKINCIESTRSYLKHKQDNK
jgi:hypothetical protein